MGASPSRAHKKRLARVPRVQVTALKPGDVLLERIPMHTPHVTRGIDDGVLRGVVATQQGGYFASQERTISGKHPETGALLVIQGTLLGLEVFPLLDRIAYVQASGGQVAVRQLQPATRQDAASSVVAQLVEIALFGCAWAHFVPSQAEEEEVGEGEQEGEQEKQEGAGHRDQQSGSSEGTAAAGGGGGGAGGAAGASPGAALQIQATNTSSSAGSPTSAAVEALVKELVPRVWAAARTMPAQARLEVLRTFNRFDLNGDGNVSRAEVRAVLRELKGEYVSKREAKRFLTSLDANNDGVLTLDEFAAAIARKPVQKLPLEHDLGGMVSAAVVALAFRRMGYLPSRSRNVPTSIISPTAAAASGHAAAPPSGSGRSTGGAQRAAAKSPAGGRISADTIIAHGPSVVHFEPGSFSSAQRAPPLRLAGAALMPEAVPVQPAARRTKHRGALLGCLCRNSGKGKVMSQ